MSKGNSKLVSVGSAEVFLNGSSIGYTNGGITVSYETETLEVEADQVNAILDEIPIKETFQVTAPLTEEQIAQLSLFFSTSTFVVDGKTWEGIYDSTATYAIGDVVLFDNLLYENTTGTSTDNPKIDTTNWSEVADSVKRNVILTGEAGGSLLSDAFELVIKPLNKSANYWITVHHAVPIPNMEFMYGKDEQRVFEVVLKGLVGQDGKWVEWGDVTATAA